MKTIPFKFFFFFFVLIQNFSCVSFLPHSNNVQSIRNSHLDQKNQILSFWVYCNTSRSRRKEARLPLSVSRWHHSIRMTLCIIFYFIFNSFLIDVITNYFAKNQNIRSHFSRLETRAINSSSSGVVDLMCPTGKSVVMKFPTIENVVKRVVTST